MVQGKNEEIVLDQIHNLIEDVYAGHYQIGAFKRAYDIASSNGIDLFGRYPGLSDYVQEVYIDRILKLVNNPPELYGEETLLENMQDAQEYVGIYFENKRDLLDYAFKKLAEKRAKRASDDL